MQAKKASKKAVLLQKMTSGDPSLVQLEGGLAEVQQQHVQQGGLHTATADVTHVVTKGEAAALLRAAEKLGAK